MDLLHCDPAKPDKSCKSTAEKIVELLNEHNFHEHLDKMTFSSDYALYKGILAELKKLGRVEKFQISKIVYEILFFNPL